MKLFSILAIALAILASCEQSVEGELDKLKAERDSLKEVRFEIDEKIFALETQIAKIDSTADQKLVTTYQARRDTFRHFFEVYGVVETDFAATLYAESNGVIEQIRVKEGQEVRKGDILAKQDDEIVNKNIREVETQLDLATTLFEKQKKLWEQNVGSEVQYLEAKNRKESLESTLATLREQKNKASVRAPFDGVIDKIYPKVGELAAMGTPIIRLVNLDQLYLTADVSERYITDIEEGDDVKIIINRKDTVLSKISRIGKYVNPTNRSFEIRVEINEQLNQLRPNSLVVLQINDHIENDAILVPSSIIMQDGKGKDYVYVLGTDKNNFQVASKRSVSTGMSYEGMTVVKSGVEQSDKLIDKGSRSVRDGDRVEETKI
jgi:RND family efflux transporter MFP subunit